MNLDETIEKVLQFTKDRDWDQFHSPENLAKSIAIEAGELLECYQWNGDANIENVKEELADVLTYCILLAGKLNLNPLDIIVDKLEKSAAKYPVEKSFGSSVKYDRF